MSRGRLFLVAGSIAALVGINYAPVAWGSIAGEENATLVQILAEAFKITDEMRDLNEAAHVTAETISDVRDTYNMVYAGVEELRSYTFDSFVEDFKNDLYHQYPGLGELHGASENLKHWEDTHTRSPFTAYEAISAAAGDISKGLQDQIDQGKVDIDAELILAGEAAGAFAIATTSEDATLKFDHETAELNRFAQQASPGQSEQISARAMMLIAAQNSYMIRLLSRSVRLDGVDHALEYRARMRARDGMRDVAQGSVDFMQSATEEPALMTFDDLE